MTKEQIRTFLGLIGATNVIVDEREWVRASCPLAPWFHEKGHDRRPSFGIKMGTEKEAPYYHCYSCGANGPLPKLLHNLTWLTGSWNKEASALLSSLPELYEREEKAKIRKRVIVDKYATADSVREVKRNEPVPDSVLADLPLLTECDTPVCDDVRLWLQQERHIEMQSIAAFQLRLYYEPVIGNAGVVMPIISPRDNKVYDLWVRMMGEKAFFRLTPRMMRSEIDYRAPNLWFGQHLFDARRPLIYVEGGLDAMRLHTLGVSNAVASMGGPSAEQLAGMYAPVAYLGFDADDSGRRFAKKTYDAIASPTIFYLNWAVEQRADGRPLKDAGDLIDLAQFRRVFDARKKFVKVPKVELIPKKFEKKVTHLANKGQGVSFL